MKKFIKMLLLITLVFISMFSFAGCASTDKSEMYMQTDMAQSAQFNYDSINNETRVRWYTTITNNTIYNMEKFSVKFQLFNGEEQVDTIMLNYNKKVNFSKEYSGWFNFTVDGKVTGIEYVSWSGEEATFWETYKVWIIVASVVLVVALVIYIIIMKANYLDYGECWESIFDSEFGLVIFFFCLTLGSSIISLILAGWVCFLIVLGTLILFELLRALVHGIEYLTDYGCDCFDGCWSDCMDCEACSYGYKIATVKNIEKTVNKKEDLSLYTKAELIEYCQKNDIHGYSKLSKTELISLIEKEKLQNVKNISADLSENLSKKSNTIKNVESKQIEVVKDNKTALQELDELIGLESVKQQLKRIRAFLIKNKNTNEKMNLHMCFYGNPGTGKTVVARLMAKIFYEEGILPKNKLIETDRGGLCGQYIGQTAPLVHKKVKEAMGGVLFIDEAYTLYSGSGQDDYGSEAIAALLKDMEDYKGKFCVILAGYKTEMEEMIAQNPGFDSRINRKIEFPDYTLEEQSVIFGTMLAAKKYEITEDARESLLSVFAKLAKQDNFANARTVRNVMDSLIEIQSVRTLEDDIDDNDDERIIRKQDVEIFVKEQGII